MHLDCVRCPQCLAAIDVHARQIVCGACGRAYPRLGEIPILLPDPAGYLAACLIQLARFVHECERSIQVIEQAPGAPASLPATRERCRLMVEAIRTQVADVCAALEPVLAPHAAAGTLPSPASPDQANEVPSPLTYIHYLYRDWGWPAEANGEKEQTLALVNSVRSNTSLGRVLVLGAGACRLPYDLHWLDPESVMVAVDIDPLVLTASRAVIRGMTIAMTEANADFTTLDAVARRWQLSAPAGAIAERQFQFIVANALDVPFLAEAFDTVLTSWFIDLVPPDLASFLPAIATLLKPQGTWINVGPLRYPADLPVERRYVREEIFDLAAWAGLALGSWRVASVPYLVSKLGGRGRIEHVIAFAATKQGSAAFPAPIR